MCSRIFPAKNCGITVKQICKENNNGHIFLYIATIKALNITIINVTKPKWRILVDQRTQLESCDFYDTKSGITEPACENLTVGSRHINL